MHSPRTNAKFATFLIPTVARQVEGPRQWLSFPADASAAPIVAAVAAAYDVADLSIQEPAIEDVIRDLYSATEPRT